MPKLLLPLGIAAVLGAAALVPGAVLAASPQLMRATPQLAVQRSIGSPGCDVCGRGFSSRGADLAGPRMLNPQPLPPKALGLTTPSIPIPPPLSSRVTR
jgi:hypothetical protein